MTKDLTVTDQKIIGIYAGDTRGYVRFNVYKEFTPSQAVPSVSSGVYNSPVGNVTLTAQEGMNIYYSTFFWAGGDLNQYNSYTSELIINNPDTLKVIVEDPVTKKQSGVLSLNYIIVDGTIVPSAELGSTDGLTLSIGGDVYFKKFFVQATAGNRYSLYIYAPDGTPANFADSSLNIFLKDQDNNWITSSGPINMIPQGVAVLCFEAESEISYFLEINNYSEKPEEYILKILENPPAQPRVSEVVTPITEPVYVSLIAEEGATIYYYLETWDAISPQPSPTYMEYTSPILVDRALDLMLYCIKNGNSSALANYYFGDIQAPGSPNILPEETRQLPGTQVTITGAATGDIIYYTTDGSNPYNSPTRQAYSEDSNIQVSNGLEIRAIIQNSSGIYGCASYRYYEEGIPMPTVDFVFGVDEEGGHYKIEISIGAAGGEIYNTIDGSDPQIFGILYTNPIIIRKNTELRAVTKLNGDFSVENKHDFSLSDERKIELDILYDGYLPKYSSSEWFEFTIPAAGKYSFEIIPSESNRFSEVYHPIELYDSSKWWTLSYTQYSTGPLVYSFTSPGTYYIKINGHDSTAERYDFIAKTLLNPPMSNLDSGTTVHKLTGLIFTSPKIGAEIFYTTDGSEPTTLSAKYVDSSSINITTDGTHTIKAIAVTDRGTDLEQVSGIAEYVYIVDSTLFSEIAGIQYYSYGTNGWSYYDFNSEDSYSSTHYDIKIKPADLSGISNVKYYITPEEQSNHYIGENYPWNTVRWNAKDTPYTGKALLKAIAYDELGNSGEFSLTINIEMTPPDAPLNFTATPSEGSIGFSWDPCPGASQYNLYKGTSEDNLSYYKTEYGTSISDMLSDTGVCYYAITVVNTKSFESSFSTIVSASALEDITPPTISFYPYYIEENDFIRSKVYFYAEAEDNAGIKNVKVEASPTGENNWTLLATNGYTGILKVTYYGFMFPDTFSDGVYDLRATVADNFGLTGTAQITVTLDNTSPEAPELLAESMPGKIKLIFNKPSEDIVSYEIYRALLSDDFTLYPSYSKNDAEQLEYIDLRYNDIGKEYKYKVVAVDKAENKSNASNIVTATVGNLVTSLTLSPEIVKPGDELTFAATGFKPGEYIKLYCDNVLLSEDLYLLTDGDGKIEYTYTIPATLTGLHTFKAEGHTTKARAVKTYTIKELTPVIEVSNDNPAANNIIVITASGFAKSGSGYESIKILVDNVNISTVYHTDGVYTYNYKIPYLANGVINIKVVGSSSGYVAEKIIDVTPMKPEVAITPEGIGPGGSITFTASGFAPNETVYIYAGESTSYETYISTNESGNGTKAYTIPINTTGTQVYTFKGDTSKLEASAAYTVAVANLVIDSVDTIAAGEKLSIALSGFVKNEGYDLYINGIYKTNKNANVGTPLTFEYTTGYSDIGNISVELYGNSSKNRISKVVSVTVPENVTPVLTVLAPDGYISGKSVTLSVSGFLPGETVSYYVNGSSYLTYKTAKEDGSCDPYEYTLPSDGPFVFTASGSTSKLTAAADSGTTLSIGYTGGSYKPGDTVAATITGLTASESIKAYFRGVEIGTYTASLEGELEFSYKLPYNTPAGTFEMVFVSTYNGIGGIQVNVTASAASMTISPETIKPSTEITVNISGFAPNENINLVIGNVNIIGVKADGEGNTSYSYIIPSNTPARNYKAIATGETSRFTVSKEYTVSSVTASITVVPSESLPDGTVTISLSGFAHGEKLAVWMDGAKISSADLAADDAGSASFQYNIPKGVKEGEKTVVAQGLASGRTATTTHTVGAYSPAVVIVPEEAKAGENITISISGYAPNDNSVKYYLNNNEITSSVSGNILTNEAGELTVSYTLPVYLAGGSYTIKVAGSNGSIIKSASILVEAAAAIIKALNSKGFSEGKVGTEITISGQSFTPSTDAAVYFDGVVISPQGFKTGDDGSFSINYSIPTGTLEGEHIFKAMTTEHEAQTSFIIDNEAPGKPVATVVTGKREIILSWNASTSTDIDGFRIYRKLAEQGDFEKIQDVSKSTLSITQKIIEDIQPGTDYIYGISAYDRLGNESVKTEVTAALLADTGSSVIDYVTPSNDSYLSKTKVISLNAYDDQYINRLLIEYSKDDGVTFKTLYDGTLNYYYKWNERYYYYKDFSWNTLGDLPENRFADSSYIIRLTVFDLANNQGVMTRNYVVDNTPPPAPTNVTAIGSTNMVTLKWDPILEDVDAVNTYKIYMGTAEDNLTHYATVNSGQTKQIEMNTTEERYFAVSAVDKAGNEGSMSNPIKASAIDDTIPPQITNIYPKDEYRNNHNSISIWITGQDNYRIKHFVLEYKLKADSLYTEAAIISAPSNVAVGEAQTGYYAWDTTSLNGVYDIRTKAVDYGDNESEYLTVNYTLDKTPPAKPVSAHAQTISGGIKIIWSAVFDEDLTYYRVYRKGPGQSEFSFIANVSRDTTSYNDYGINPGDTYTYAVTSRDDLGNESEKQETSAIDSVGYTPSMTISPDTDLKAGDNITITAQGFKPNEYVYLYIDSNETLLAYLWTNIDGNTSGNWRYVINTAPRTHTLKLIGYSSGAQTSVIFETLPNDMPAPQNLTATAEGILAVKVSYDGVPDAYAYNIYRKVEGLTEYSVAAKNIYSTSYTDTSIAPFTSYIYKVCAVDTFGNEGAMSAETEPISPDQDTVKPVISAFTADRKADVLMLNALVSDNISVSNVVFKYRAVGAGEYTDISTVVLNSQRDKKVVASYPWNTLALETDSYEILAQVTDSSGNAIEDTITINIRSGLPQAAAVVTAVSCALRMNVSWEAETDSDFKEYRLYRSQDNGVTWTMIHKTALKTYTDYKVLANISYKYAVTIYDNYDRESLKTESDNVIALADTDPPVITGLSPVARSRINTTASISVLAQDNVGVTNIKLELVKPEGNVLIGENTRGTVSFDTTKHPDGEIEILVSAYDGSGNIKNATYKYIIDNTPPTVPAATANGSELKVQISINPAGMSQDFAKYKIFRSASSTDGFTQIAAITENQYVDTQASAVADNYYYVTAVDTLGNESAPSVIISAKAGGDITKPVVTSLEPGSDTPLRGALTLKASATDNVEVKSIIFENRELGSDGITPEGDGTWKTITTIDGNSASYSWDTVKEEAGAQLTPDGFYEIRARAVDNAGNAGVLSGVYVISNDPPAPPDGLRVFAAPWELVVSWDPINRADFSHYVVYRRSSVTGEWQKVKDRTTSTLFMDTGLNPQDTYYYAVSMVNDLGRESAKNSEYSGVNNAYTSLHQTTAPIIRRIKPDKFYFNGTLELEALIEEDINLTKANYYYTYIGEEESGDISAEAEWHLIGQADLKKEYVNLTSLEGLDEEFYLATITWDAGDRPAGLYAVKVQAHNESAKDSSFIRKFFLDKTAPDRPAVLNVVNPRSGGSLNITTGILGPNMSHYTLYSSTDPDAAFNQYQKIESTKSSVYSHVGLTNGQNYFYYITVTDEAGNESLPSYRASGTPTAESDLSISGISSQPETPAIGREAKITASVKNLGFAKAKGKVIFSYNTGDGWNPLGEVTVDVPLSGTVAIINWTAVGSGTYVDIKAEIETLTGTDDIGNAPKSSTAGFALNAPPMAVIVAPDNINSGEITAFKSTGSIDDGSMAEYKWEFGDGKSLNGSTVSYAYSIPGTYTIKLTVTDNLGEKTTVQKNITVLDTRPDLFIEDIIWSPEDPNEKDVVTIKTIIGNKGKGPSTMSFLTGFYIDNQYMGYVAVNGDIEVGKTAEATFTWVATSGEHVVKVVANDILDNLKESDKTNNSMTVGLSSTQVTFADVRVNSIAWYPQNEYYSSQEPFEYRAEIENIGDRSAEGFSVGLYIDDKYISKQVINKLEPGAVRTVNFSVVPVSGVHNVRVVADDPAPVLIELDTNNNSMTIETDNFIVQYPTIEIGEITWEPKETMFADGTSLNFEASITNNSPVAITQKFNVNFTMDSIIIRTQSIDGLKAGETKKITARWVAKENSDGTRNVAAVIVDPDGKVLETAELTKSVTLPAFKIIYPNLHISTVNWSPIDGSYNSPVTFTATISNDSLATVFKRFTIGLYVREACSTDSFRQVTGYVVEGLRGYSSAFVPLTWTPNKAGQYEFKIMTDIYGEVKQQPITEENDKNRAYTGEITVKDRLVMKAYPSEEDADDDILAVLYSSTDRIIPISAQFFNSASSGVYLSPDDGINSSYTLKSGSVIVSEGQLNYSYAAKKFTMDIPTAMLDSGTYILEIAGTDGGTALTSTVNIRIIQDVLASVSTDKKLYNLGETAVLEGTYAITIIGIVETEERNQFSDKQVEQVLIIDYI